MIIALIKTTIKQVVRMIDEHLDNFIEYILEIILPICLISMNFVPELIAWMLLVSYNILFATLAVVTITVAKIAWNYQYYYDPDKMSYGEFICDQLSGVATIMYVGIPGNIMAWMFGYGMSYLPMICFGIIVAVNLFAYAEFYIHVICVLFKTM
jgi:hypothetical protein